MPDVTTEKTLLARLLLKPGVKLAILNLPKGQEPPAGAQIVSRGKVEALLLYVEDTAQLEASWDKARARLADDGRLWIAYPKAGKLGTDLNRDVISRRVRAWTFDTVRQVAIDATWSALWVKPIA